MISVHVLAPVRFCHAAINEMLRRKRGAIINVSSLAAFGFGANTAMYIATKAFLKAFTESIAIDLQGTKIKFQALCPGYIDTEIFEKGDYKTNPFPRSFVPDDVWMTAKDCVSQSLAKLGRGKVTFIPGGEPVRAYFAIR